MSAMRVTGWIGGLFLLHGVCFGLLAQQPTVVNSSFTRQQTAVYQAFFSQNRKDDSVWLNVADQTFILQPDDGDYSGCMHGFSKSEQPLLVHRLGGDFARTNHIHAVDPKTPGLKTP
jgi:hypothetical protein